MLLRIAFCFLLPLLSCSAADPSDSELKRLYETHQWFELRDIVQANKAPAFYRGAVAYAFNSPEQAEKDLQQVIQSQPGSDQAYDARELLVS